MSAGLKIVVLLRRLRARPDGAGARQLCGACDQSALRAALALRSGSPGASLVALAAGPAASEDEVLRWAIAAGADRGVRVDDPILAAIDYHGLGRALGGAARQLGADLVLCGDRSEDEVQGAVGPAVAEALGVPHLTSAIDLELTSTSVTARRREGGVIRTLRLPLPALVAVLSHAGGPQLPAAAPPAPEKKDKTITALDLAGLGIQALELKHRDRLVGRAHPVRVARNATMVSDAEELVARLREDRLLG